ncbi:MAG: hypothetical protein AB1736_15420 [Chloroflexota bacterium]
MGWGRVRRVSLVVIGVLVAATSSNAANGAITWVPGEWHGRLSMVGSLTGPDTVTTVSVLSSRFEFRLDAVGGVYGTKGTSGTLDDFAFIDDFGGVFSVEDEDIGSFTVDASISDCQLHGDSFTILFDCLVILSNTYVVGDAPITVEHRFLLTDVDLAPITITCSQAYGRQALYQAPIEGTSLSITGTFEWMAFRTEVIDQDDMVETVNDMLDEIDAANSAGDYLKAIELIRGLLSYLPNIGNTMAKAEVCREGQNATGALWPWLRSAADRTILGVIDGQALFTTYDLIGAVSIGVGAGVMATSNADTGVARERKQALETALGFKLENALAAAGKLAPERGNAAADEELAVLEREIRAIATAAKQYGMNELYAKVPGAYR